MQTKLVLGIVGIATVLTFYFSLQFLGVVNSSYTSRDVIAQTRLTNVQFIVDSTSIRSGYFQANFTFENPAIEDLALARIQAVYYEVTPVGSNSSERMSAEARTEITDKIHSGQAVTQVRMTVVYHRVENESSAPSSVWRIKYHPKLGATAYEMIAEVHNSTIQTSGPFRSFADETYFAATTQVFSIIGVWVIGLEIVAISLIRDRRQQEFQQLPRVKPHNMMVSIAYLAQGLGLVASLFLFSFVNGLIAQVPSDPNYIPYGGHGAIGAVVDIISTSFIIIGMIYLVIALGLFLRADWVRRAAVIMSFAAVLSWLCAALLIIRGNIAAGILYFAVAGAHGIVIYVLTLGAKNRGLATQTV